MHVRSPSVEKIALLGNHSPRKCGIATFTTDLADALLLEGPSLDCFVVAMNDPGKRHPYPARVGFEIAEGDLSSYRHAADYINVNGVDVVSVQHEYGIFGGKAGSHLLALLRELRMPIVATLHTILQKPNPAQRAVMDELLRLSQRIVVMSTHGATLLQEVHNTPSHKIDVIPHGIPDIPLDDRAKEVLGVEGKNVLLTFGLLSPDKGIEHVINALPSILAKFPETVYFVVGATHPHVKEHDGEAYRLSLENRVHSLGLDSHVIFQNRFVSQVELTEFLSAADVYLTPYLKVEQITSGTLAYALGAGKAVLSTPYWYATELLADGRGILVPWRDPRAISENVIGLLADPERRQQMQARAAAYGKDMRWPAVAHKYLASFHQARAEQSDRLRTAFRDRPVALRPTDLPDFNLEHLKLMTDSTGLLQHASFTVPCYDRGYCVDDNARALLLMAMVEESNLEGGPEIRSLASRYLAFVDHSFNAVTGRFRNFMTYSRRWTEECGSEDSHGRALWALGTVVGRSSAPGRQSLGNDLFHRALPAVTSFTSPRAWAYSLLGIDEYLRAFAGDTALRHVRQVLSDKLHTSYLQHADGDWRWFENSLSYSNARLSQALIVSGLRMDRPELVSAGLESLTWLARVQTSPEGYFSPIGSNGFWVRGGKRASFDQQPVEACGMISAALVAKQVTGSREWDTHARRAFDWFLGQNHLQRSLIDTATGGCRDGLHAERVNENQGAESTLSFLHAWLEMHSADAPLPSSLT